MKRSIQISKQVDAKHSAQQILPIKPNSTRVSPFAFPSIVFLSVAVAIASVVLLTQAPTKFQRNTMASSLNLSESVSAFSADLYETIRAATPETQNIILSPLSVQMAIGLALMGAGGKTAAEIAHGLKLGNADPTAVAHAFESLIAPLSKSPLLKIANKVYVQNAYHIKEAYNNIATKQFRSETQTLDFAQSANSAKTINQWVGTQTNDRIKDLISEDCLSADTRLVLVNAIYFKGFWEHKFDVASTVKEPFFNTETTSVDVDMMHLSAKVPFAVLDQLDAKVLQLKYKDSDISMIIVLPNKRTGLAALDAQLKDTNLASIVKELRTSGDVQVSLPKFKVEFEVSLPETLKKLGMQTMFSSEADFSGLLEESDPIQVSEVVHKAFIEVNEEGAEAAAATGVVMMMRSMPMKFPFEANHPFHYFIANGANVILFSGSYRQASA